MAGLNKVQIIGHLGNDPETKFTQAGVAVTNISVATTEKWKDRDGNQQERTEWHRVTFWNKLAEIAGEYLRKGSQVYVEGKLQTDKYTDQNGVEKYATKIIASEMQMLGGRPDNDNRQAGGGQQRNQSPRQQGGGQDYAPRRQQPEQQQSAPPDELDYDSIPF